MVKNEISVSDYRKGIGRKKMKHSESKLQRECVKWFRACYPSYLLFSIPNGGKRGVVEASIMKAEGVLAGVPDLFLATPNANSIGLFIEMKSEKGKLTDNQKWVIGRLESFGYKVAVCKSIEEFMKSVNEYLNP